MTVGANDLTMMGAFYDAFFAPLGITRFMTDDESGIIGWRRDTAGSRFFVTIPFDRQPARPGNGTMCAFEGGSRDAVDRAYQAALACGGTDSGAPGLRPHYSPTYYGAYVRDPEGNKVHVVHRGA